MHEYKHVHVWENPSEDDELICEHEIGNAHMIILTQWHYGKISIERLGQWDISQEFPLFYFHSTRWYDLLQGS